MPYFFRLRNSGFITFTTASVQLSVRVSICFLDLPLSGRFLCSPHLKLSLYVFMSMSLPVFTLSVSIPWRFFYQFLCLPLFLFSSFFKISHVPVRHFEQKTNFISNQRLYFFLSFYYNIFFYKEKKFFCSLPKLSCLSCDSTKSG